MTAVELIAEWSPSSNFGMVTSTRRKTDLYFESEKFSCNVGNFPDILKRARLVTLGTMEIWTCKSMLIRSVRCKDEPLREFSAFLQDCRSPPRMNCNEYQQNRIF